MVVGRTALQLESVGCPRWDAALGVLETGQAAVGFAGLTLSCDQATARVGRRLHVEFPCFADPVVVGTPARERLAEFASQELDRARGVVKEVRALDACVSRRW